jgi:hypothetical protein
LVMDTHVFQGFVPFIQYEKFGLKIKFENANTKSTTIFRYI